MAVAVDNCICYRRINYQSPVGRQLRLPPLCRLAGIFTVVEVDAPY